MKTSTLSLIAMVSILAVSSVAFAQGRSGAVAGAASAGTQTRIHTPGTGLLPGATPLQTRIHTPGSALVTPTPVPAPVVN
jgi:hypothetical protein